MSGAPRRRKIIMRVAGAALLALAVPVIILGIMNPGNVAQTRPDHPDPLLRTRHYATTISKLQETIMFLTPTLRIYGRRWLFTSMQESGEPKEGGSKTGQVDIIVPVIVFSDDLVVTSREEEGGVVCDVRSASRVGKGDFGENARHIRQFLGALDEKFSQTDK